MTSSRLVDNGVTVSVTNSISGSDWALQPRRCKRPFLLGIFILKILLLTGLELLIRQASLYIKQALNSIRCN